MWDLQGRLVQGSRLLGFLLLKRLRMNLDLCYFPPSAPPDTGPRAAAHLRPVLHVGPVSAGLGHRLQVSFLIATKQDI